MPISFLCWAVWMSQGLSCSIHILHKRFSWLINLLLSGHGQGNVWVSFSMDSRAKGSWGWERNLLILFYVIFLLCVKGSEPETETRCCLCVPIKSRLTKPRLLLTFVTHLPLGFILCKCIKKRESAKRIVLSFNIVKYKDILSPAPCSRFVWTITQAVHTSKD